ncbi:MAG TPA: cupin domain-containing protein [Gemmatimonadales bacterium]|jgi:hypothetical protein|nr:cupin domain-containing protein [Gemmatimonadales bacterium]
MNEARRHVLASAAVAVSLSLVSAPSAMAQASAEPAALHWTVPDVLQPGALIAVVSGDPTGPGESTLQLSMPDGYRIAPHFHPSYEHVEVREGTLLVGMGDQLDPKQTRPWPPAIRPPPPRGCTISRSPRGGLCCP